MPKNSDGNGATRLEALRKREAALREQIAAERIRLERKREREHARLASIVGACLLDDLSGNSETGLLIEESLKRNSDPRDAEFLRSKGFRI